MGLTGEKTHAEKSLELLLGYAGTLKRIPETNDAPLLVGLEGLKIIMLLKYCVILIKDDSCSV